MDSDARIHSRERAMMGVQAQFDRYHKIAQATGYSGHDRHLMSDLNLLDASIGPPSSATSPTTSDSHPETPAATTLTAPPNVLATATFSLLIDDKYGNINGVLHGGAVGVILDMVTTAAIAPLARKGHWEFLAGVTRTMGINYLKPVGIGTTVYVHGHVYSLGKTMAFIKGYVTSPDGYTVYMTCDVNKVGLPAKAEHMEYRIPWDQQGNGEQKPKL